MVAEALECLGGNGYVEESGLPLLFRESPLNSIWEGSGNVNALDVLRALSREPEVLDAWITEVGAARGADPRLDRAIETARWRCSATPARWRSARAGSPGGWRPACRARCWCASPRPRWPTRSARPGSDTAYDGTFGTLPPALGTDALRAIVERATPVVDAPA